MFEIQHTDTFVRWLAKLKDRRGRDAIVSRIDQLRYGHTGDVKPVEGGISELRIHDGPGYRVYFRQQGQTIILLLCGGDKDTQRRDIKVAKQLVKQLKITRLSQHETSP